MRSISPGATNLPAGTLALGAVVVSEDLSDLVRTVGGADATSSLFMEGPTSVPADVPGEDSGRVAALAQAWRDLWNAVLVPSR